jgi:hypothetical protein
MNALRRTFATLGGALCVAAVIGAIYQNPRAHAQPGPGAYGPLGQAIVPLYGNLQGAYSKGLVSGTMAAGLAANSPVYAFRYGGTGIAVIRDVRLSAADITTAFATTTCHFDLFMARAFTASDTGGTAGTLTTNNGKLRTSFATTAVSQIMIATTATNTAGTRTLDTDPASAVTCAAVATAGNQFLAPTTITPNAGIAGDYPMALANNEGFVIQATVPATGTWNFTVTTDWEEFSQY